MSVPTLTLPAGDPTGLRGAAQRLDLAAQQLRGVGQRLETANEEVARVWQSHAQRLFSVLADGFSGITLGAGEIAASLSTALGRYAGVLEQCQAEVRAAQHQLLTLHASTPAGVPADPGAVATIVARVRRAEDTASQAARELTSVASDLIGPMPNGTEPGAGGASPSFVSRAHAGAGLVSSDANAAFDAQAVQFEHQLTSVIGALTGAGSPQPAEPGAILGGASVIGGGHYSNSITITDANGQPADLGAILGGAGLIGGGHYSNSIAVTDASGGPAHLGGILGGAAVIGGPRSGEDNIVMTLTRAQANTQTKRAQALWREVFPGVPAPEGDAGSILSQMLRRGGDSLDTNALRAISIVTAGPDYDNRLTTLQEGYELVRRPY